MAKEIVDEEPPWTLGDDIVSLVEQRYKSPEETPLPPSPSEQRTDPDSPQTPGKGESSAQPGETESSVIDKIGKGLGWISPGGLGCAIVMLIVGMLIVFAGKDIFHFLADGKVVDIVRPTTTAIPVPPRSLILLGTSPDGIVYYFNSPTGIFYRDSDSISTSIATLSAFEAFHWSPQGNKTAFIVQDRNDTLPLLYVLDLTNPPSDGQLRLVTQRNPDGFPAEFGLRAESPVAWSQDEEYIAFVAYDRTRKAALFVSEVATGKVRGLTEGTEPVTSVAWETYKNDQGVDDERIVYVLVRDGRELVYSVEKDGAENNPWRH